MSGARTDGLEQPHHARGRSSSAGSAACPGPTTPRCRGASARLDRAPRTIERPAPVTPYAELHCHSHFSFLDGASSPAELVEEAVRLGLHALAITDHDGFYGAPMLAEAAAAYDLPAHVFGAELSLGLSGPQNGVPDPEGSHLLVLARGRRGLPPAGRGDDRRPPARRREGPPGLRPRRARRAGPRPLGGAHRLPQGRGPPGARRRAVRRRRPRQLDRLTSLFGLEHVSSSCRRADPAPTPTNALLAGLAAVHGLDVVAAGNVHHATPQQHRLASAMAAVRARRSLAELDGWLDLSGSAHLRSGAEMAAALRRYPGAVARSVTLADELAFDLRKASPALPKRQIPEGHTADSWLRVLAERGFAERYAGVPHERRGARAARARAAGHRREGLRRLLRHRPRHRRLRPRAADPLPGPGLGGQLGGLLRPRHHRGRRGLLPAAVRALHLRAPRRGARHRRRLRLRPARGGHPVGLRHLRPPQRRAGRQRHRLPAADGGARRRQGARLLPGPAGRVVQADRRLAVRGRRRPGDPAAHDVPAPVVALAEELMGAPRHLGIHSGGMVLTERPIGEVCPIERARMERRTVLQWDKDACESMGLVKFDLLGPGHARRARPHDAAGRRPPRRAVGPRDDAQGGAGGLRHALPRRLDRGLPGREPRPDRHAAAAAAARVLRPRHRDRPDPARPDPGRRRAPLRPPGHRRRSRSPTTTPSWCRCSSAPRACRSSRSS